MRGNAKQPSSGCDAPSALNSPLQTRREVLAAAPDDSGRRHGHYPRRRSIKFDEQRRIPAEEAHQAVAADERFLYAMAITSSASMTSTPANVLRAGNVKP